MKWLNSLASLQPVNSLFGRIFIWFWSAIIVMVVLAFMAAKYFSHTWEISAPDVSQIARAERILANLTNLINRGARIDGAMRRVGMRSQLHIMSVDPESGKFEFGFPPSLLNNRSEFLELRDEQTPYLIRTGNMEVIGPFLIEINQRNLQFYVGKLLRREQRPRYVFGVALGIVLLVGTLACLVISWNLAKPLKQLSLLSKSLATDPSTQADAALQSRKDEIGQLHKDVFDMAYKLVESLTKQKQLMANISHELRTPLTRLQLATAMLNPTKEQLKYANRIEKDITIMDALIAQSLQLAKLNNDSDNSFVMSDECDIKTVISPLYDDLQFEAKAKQVELTINQYPEIKLAIHKASFISALENIIRNGINYCKGKVQIELYVQSNDNPIQNLVIDIDDDGKGVEEKNMPLLFSPFFRAHQNHEKKGTGLGLTIAKTAVERHNGKIEVSRSALGGLRVSVSIPIITKHD